MKLQELALQSLILLACFLIENIFLFCKRKMQQHPVFNIFSISLQELHNIKIITKEYLLVLK